MKKALRKAGFFHKKYLTEGFMKRIFPNVKSYILYIMKSDELLKEARGSSVAALRLGKDIVSGDIELPIGKMLEAFSIVYQIYLGYGKEYDEAKTEQEKERSLHWLNMFQEVVNDFYEVFYDFEIEILSYLSGLKKSEMTEDEQKTVKYLLKACQKDDNLSVELRNFELAE